MNRSILIVICDFLLVSLLAFSTVDINQVADSGQASFRMDLSKKDAEAGKNSQADSGKDLAAVMRLALDEERRNRNQLLGELEKNRASASQREQQIQQFQEQLAGRQQQALELQQQQTNLQQQLVSAQANVENLNQQLHSTSTQAVISRERLAAMEAEARKQSERAAALEQQLSQLSQSNQTVAAEKQRLSTQLQVVQAEKHAATEQVARMTEQVKTERAEKAKLAEGVKVLASKSSQLAEQIRENQPMAPNTIFNEFVTNRVEARFNATKTGLFGSNQRKETETILVGNGTNTFALCHVQDTPLTLWNPGTDWDQLTGQIRHGWASFPIHTLFFSLQDPRLVWIQLTPDQVSELGCKVYQISANPFKFQDAVIVGTQDPYYGECKFEIDVGTPDYVRLDRNFLKGLFGKFNPSRGDLVFSRTGELLGIMANDVYCLMIRNFNATAALRFGQDMRDQHTGIVLSQLYYRLSQFPAKLQ